MWKRVIGVFLSLSLILSVTPLYAQGKRGMGNEISQRGPRKQLTTIVFSGLAGAILGLSTLSFYGRPQEKLSNIAIGFAFGVIIGATYTTFQAATNPRDFYGENHFPATAPQFGAVARDRSSPQMAAMLDLQTRYDIDKPRTLGFVFDF